MATSATTTTPLSPPPFSPPPLPISLQYDSQFLTSNYVLGDSFSLSLTAKSLSLSSSLFFYEVYSIYLFFSVEISRLLDPRIFPIVNVISSFSFVFLFLFPTFFSWVDFFCLIFFRLLRRRRNLRRTLASLVSFPVSSYFFYSKLCFFLACCLSTRVRVCACARMSECLRVFSFVHAQF